METKRIYRVKREDLNRYVPKYWDILTERVPIFATGPVGWQNFIEDGKQVAFDNAEEAQAYIDKKQQEGE